MLQVLPEESAPVAAKPDQQRANGERLPEDVQWRVLLKDAAQQGQARPPEQGDSLRGGELGAVCCLHVLDNHAKLLATQWL